MIAALLAAIIICGDARDVPFSTSTCPESEWGKLCGCGGTLVWEQPPPGPGEMPVHHYSIERQFLNVWTTIGTCPATQLWWKTSEDRPLGFEGFKYFYRVWSIAANGTASVIPSNPAYLIGNPRVCVDSVTRKKVSCWAPGGPGAP